MPSLIDIQMQIAELQAKAQEIKTREFNEKVNMIKETMVAFDISFDDLHVKPVKTGKVKSSVPAPAKYAGPKGEFWSGRGLMPRWLATLVKDGHSREEYLITK